MSPAADPQAIEDALALARELAPRMSAVVLTHFPDADTLDLMRPGAGPLEAVAALNRALAAELAHEGVQVLVQVADRAAFRRWMDGRADTPEARRAWRNHRGLLQGDAAFQMLGLDPSAMRPPRRGKASGTPAERLMRAFADEDGGEFDELAEELVAAGRDGVLDQAIRKVAARFGEEAARELAQELLAVAEGARIGPAGWAALVALPVALPPDAPPDPVSLGESLIASGALAEELELRFLPEWRVPEALEALSPGALRRVLVEMVAGEEPTALPPAKPTQLQESGFGVLVGLQYDWAIPSWEEIAAKGLPEPPEDDKETPEEAARTEVFERWRAATYQAADGCVALALVPFSEASAEIADFLQEAGEQTSGLTEIRDFVDMARGEAPGEEVVCRATVEGERLQLALYTRAGRFLDELTLEAAQLPVPAAEMPELLRAFVPLAARPPGS
ncbi:hypothetical protein MHZ93_06380 [Roseomonas sp. ACRSG]|nr:hypothetical protein [Roseomonas sp. ACRSG]